MHKRFITLDADERATLEEGRRHHAKYQFRDRCQALLWSADGHPVASLMGLLGVSRITLYAWFNRWESDGLAGLSNAKGQGRPPILTAADQELVQAAVCENRQQLKEVTASLRQELAKDFSPLTLKRFLKSLVASGGVSDTA